ncbi:MAG: TetR/AcrR family transcriptional regulator [Pseudohongiella sp.]|nr:TetR/AcrR family transcriptional regulator [Pseudohongiella sp.]
MKLSEGVAVSKKLDKRAEVIDLLTVHFLDTGLSDTGLRRLAEVAGTSDRMLLYYFANKDELLAAVLTHIAGGLSASLTQLFGTTPLSPDTVLEKLWVAAKSDAFKPYLRLWLDLAAHANRGDPLFLSIAQQISTGWINWMASLLDVPEANKDATAALILAAVDGQLVLFPGEIARGEHAIVQLIDLFRGQGQAQARSGAA